MESNIFVRLNVKMCRALWVSRRHQEGQVTAVKPKRDISSSQGTSLVSVTVGFCVCWNHLKEPTVAGSRVVSSLHMYTSLYPCKRVWACIFACVRLSSFGFGSDLQLNFVSLLSYSLIAMCTFYSITCWIYVLTFLCGCLLVRCLWHKHTCHSSFDKESHFCHWRCFNTFHIKRNYPGVGDTFYSFP